MRIARQSCSQRSGSVLIAVLVMVVLLSLAAYQFSELMLQEYAAAQSALRATQAKALADSGVYYAAALLADKTAITGTLNGNSYNNESAFGAKQVSGGEGQRTGRFSIVAPYLPGEESSSQSFRYGVSDESGKININALVKLDTSGEVAYGILMKLPNMTEEAADSIVDWIDANEDPRTNGAESQTYSGLQPAYRCKNGPLDSIEELLLVRGVTPQLLFGADRNRNGVQDSGEDDGSGWTPGWASYLTIYSREKNVDSEGTARIFLNETTLSTSYDALTTALGQPLADFIVLYRTQSVDAPMGNNPIGEASEADVAAAVKAALESTAAPRRSISSRYSLISAVVYLTIGKGQMQKTVQVLSPLADEGKLRELLPTLLDKTTTQRGDELPARINVLSAPREVLACLPGLEDAEVQALVDSRPQQDTPQQGAGNKTDATFTTPAWMLLDAKIPAPKMQALERYVTARTQVYRVQSLGYFDNGGPVARVEAVFDTNDGRPRILMWRDLSELGRGYNVTGN